MKALSLRQPWAWLVVNGLKDIENREWRSSVRGEVLIHASSRTSQEEYEACQIFVAGFSDLRLPPFNTLERGGIVGQCRIVDCVEQNASPWFCGRYGFVIKDAKLIPFKRSSGRPGFFEVDLDNLWRVPAITQ